MSREPETDDETRTENETEATDATDVGDPVREGADASASRDRTATVDDVETLRSDVVAFAEEVEDRIVKRNDLESELKGYVRRRQRRGHARGWGPYLVLLYGTAMTIGAFFYLEGGWAILAMLVVWLSTLGLYALMVLVGFGVAALGAPGRVADRVRDFRS
ncbi:ribonuclease BN [Halococcus sp. IIIV-5B]|uniref:ribonuclease BN n=1 Tax=Halococcus sp. IIIV-5B TaxID=2321230 RepID=UPI000E75C549|nr:ribonuclease BN [Halococcus sp. IIIV-5B]RJT02700.1 ribonuclease BN [Halococcus sp. IIIV-5B]